MPQSLVLNANRIRYTYLKTTVDTKVPLRKVVDNFNDYNSTTYTYNEKLEIDFGSQTATSYDGGTNIAHSISFANFPTVIMMPDDDVNVLLQQSVNNFTPYLSDALTGNLRWIAVNDIGVTYNSTNTRVAILADAGTVSFTNQSAITVTYNKSINFKKYADTYGLTPLVLVNTNASVKSYPSSVTTTNFVLNTSEIFTGTCYWMAFLLRRL